MQVGRRLNRARVFRNSLWKWEREERIKKIGVVLDGD